jgi:glycogen debranching enzyme
LQAAFHEHFLVDAPTHVALALDTHGEAIPVRASNVGHLLATELIDDDLAAALAERLLSDDEFSGWGLRTLSRSEAAYNPLGYHDGTVWPHDTAMFLRGLNQRGFQPELAAVSRSLIELATALGGQLPELLGGFAKASFPHPVPYPASARPQGWAAAVPFQVVTALVGLRPALHDNELRLRPRLGAHDRVVIENLRLGDRTLRIDAIGRAVRVTGDTSDLNIVTDN